MSEIDPADFRESIDDMCDDAIRRIYAMQEGGLGVMQPGDAFFSVVTHRDPKLNLVEFDTTIRAEIIDCIHRDVISTEPPEYVVEILGGAVIALSRRAAFLGVGSTVIIPDIATAQNHTRDTLLLRGSALDTEQPILTLFTQRLGAAGLASLTLAEHDGFWKLYYEATRSVAQLH